MAKNSVGKPRRINPERKSDPKALATLLGDKAEYKDTYPMDVVRLADAGAFKSMLDVAFHFKITRSMLNSWATRFPIFYAALEYASESVARNSLEKVVKGDPGAIGSQWLLECNHGMMKEERRQALELQRQELDAKIQGKLGNTTPQPVSINFIDATPQAQAE